MNLLKFLLLLLFSYSLYCLQTLSLITTIRMISINSFIKWNYFIMKSFIETYSFFLSLSRFLFVLRKRITQLESNETACIWWVRCFATQPERRTFSHRKHVFFFELICLKFLLDLTWKKERKKENFAWLRRKTEVENQRSTERI